MAGEAPWTVAEWRWDPFRMVAVPEGSVKAAAMSTGETASQGHSQAGEVEGVRSPGRASKGVPVCQIDGCEADLSSLKEYHLRYKICEYHLKINNIAREGVKQRFCQQCGRFHNLSEFDGDKRSCRARLQRHNARRRKKVEPAGGKRTASSNRQGSVHSSMELQKAMEREPEVNGAELPRQPLPKRTGGPSLADAGGDVNMMEASRENSAQLLGGAMSLDAIHDFLEFTHHARAEQLAALSAEMYGDASGGAHLQAALSALSCLPPTGQSAALTQMALSQLGMPGGAGAAFGVPFDQFGLAAVHHSLATQNAAAAAAVAAAAQQAGPFHAAAVMGNGGAGGFRQLPAYAAAPAVPNGAVAAGVPHGVGLPPMLSLDTRVPGSEAAAAASSAADGAGGEVAAAVGGSVLDQARRLLASRQVEYAGDEQLARVSAKLFNCTPANLPPDLRENLVGLLRCADNGLAGYVRPGCLHLTLDALLDPAQAGTLKELGARRAVELLMQGSGGHLWSTDTALVQVGDEVALVRDGSVLHVLSAEGSFSILPFIKSVSHVAVASDLPASITVTGFNIINEDVETTILARSQGQFVTVRTQPVPGTEDEELQQVVVELPAGLRPGAVQIEVVLGGFMSQPKAVFVLNDPEAVAELEQLRDTQQTKGLDLNALALDLDRCLEFRNALVLAAGGGGGEPVRAWGPGDLAALVRAAGRLLLLAADRGWLALAGLLLPALDAHPGPAAELVAGMQAGGLSILHLAVRSGSVPMVELLLEWGAEGGYEWEATVQGPGGLTPLHLAALLDDGGAMVDALMDLCDDALGAWDTAESQDGSTPADFASLAGRPQLSVLVALKRAEAARVHLELDHFAAAKSECEAESSTESSTEAGAGTRPSTEGAGEGEEQKGGQAAEPQRDAAGHHREEYASGSAGSSSTESCIDANGRCICGSDDEDAQLLSAEADTGADARHAQLLPEFEASAVKKNPMLAFHASSAAAEKGRHGAGGTGKGKDFGAYAEYVTACEAHGIRVAPTVFIKWTALLSAIVVGGVGAATLLMRGFIETRTL